ncbi:hypothetical protein [Bdellovibrio sp. HCB337]|uniref:hypothetical protein n=1 Tax=Bdellovibrio sp. HCB337 TaxID=3394358 RepID=UPI0039A679C2
MAKTPIFVTTALCFVTSLALVACSGGNRQESKKLSYQFNENGCDTGKKEFTSKQAYCAALEDNSANNFCAESMRKTTFERECGALPTPTPQGKSDSDQPVIPQPEVDTTVIPSPETPTQPVIPSTENSVPERLVITAKSLSPLKMKSDISKEAIILLLSGEASVSDLSVDLKGPLKIDLASATTVANLAPCELTTTFEMSVDNKAVAFTLIKVGPSNPATAGCISKLNQFAAEGFTTEFSNVRVGGPLSEKFIKKVTLIVEPRK